MRWASSGRLSGLVRKSVAPTRNASSTASTSSVAVIISTAVAAPLGIARSRRHTSWPPSRGMLTSSSTRSGARRGVHGQRLDAVGGLDGREPGARQGLGGEQAGDVVVVDDQDQRGVDQLARGNSWARGTSAASAAIASAWRAGSSASSGAVGASSSRRAWASTCATQLDQPGQAEVAARALEVVGGAGQLGGLAARGAVGDGGPADRRAARPVHRDDARQPDRRPAGALHRPHPRQPRATIGSSLGSAGPGSISAIRVVIAGTDGGGGGAIRGAITVAGAIAGSGGALAGAGAAGSATATAGGGTTGSAAGGGITGSAASGIGRDADPARRRSARTARSARPAAPRRGGAAARPGPR
jgi:hypothetical protein